MCRHLLSERGEASQTALAQEIISAYRAMNAAAAGCSFSRMLSREFAPDAGFHSARSGGLQSVTDGHHSWPLICDAVEPPRQELFRRINTAPRGTETLVALREHLLELSASQREISRRSMRTCKHLFRSWFNRGFLRLERISWQTSALILEKLIRYESVHEINGWPDLRRRLEADRRCFAFFHPALADEPIIFVEVALSNGTNWRSGTVARHSGARACSPRRPTRPSFIPSTTACSGLRGVPFGNFLIKQVVDEFAAELPNIQNLQHAVASAALFASPARSARRKRFHARSPAASTRRRCPRSHYRRAASGSRGSSVPPAGATSRASRNYQTASRAPGSCLSHPGASER